MGPRSEYYGRGDALTARALPWMPGYAGIVCDGFVAGEPFEACPRQVLRRQIARLAERGWSLQTGIEPEFFLLRRSANGMEPADAQEPLGQTLLRPEEPAAPARVSWRNWPTACAAAGSTCSRSTTKTPKASTRSTSCTPTRSPALMHLMLFKQAAHSDGRAPRQRLLDDAQALRRPARQRHALPCVAVARRTWPVRRRRPTACRNCCATSSAACSRIRRRCALLQRQPVNSYKRLVVGESLSGTSWAPAVVAHGPNNRTALVRTLPGRFEWRLPDASANPYLATAALIAAGLDGIDRRPRSWRGLYRRPVRTLARRVGSARHRRVATVPR